MVSGLRARSSFLFSMDTIRIVNKHDSVEVNIEGAIGVPEEWQFENADERVSTYEKFRNTVKLIEQIQAPNVIVNIRSTGGDVNDAMLIYEALISLNATIITRCYGYVASAATIIAQAASEGERQISANSLYLIHQATCVAEGNAADLLARVELLKKTDETLADLYTRRSGKEAETFNTLMQAEGGNGRWLSAQETVEAGLADKIIEESPIKNQNVKSMIKNIFNHVRKVLGLATEDEAPEVEISEAEVKKLDEALEQGEQESQTLREQVEAERAEKEQLQTDLAEVTNRAEAAEAEAKRYKAAATKVKDVEDPNHIEPQELSGNAKAYQSDVQNFKN